LPHRSASSNRALPPKRKPRPREQARLARANSADKFPLWRWKFYLDLLERKMAKEAKSTTPPAEPANDNLRIWSRVEATDPNFTKDFKRGGGFSGTAINPTWLYKQATGVFGPIGKGWGWEIVEERQVPNAAGDVVMWFSKARIWYVLDGQRYVTPEQWGGTEMIGKNRNGPFFDEEAPKKTVTDAVGKCLVMLGFASDVHMGLYDDSKYVNDRREIAAEDAKIRDKAKQVESASDEVATWRDSVVASIRAETDLPKLQELWSKQQPVGRAYAESSQAGKAAYKFVISQMNRRVAALKQDGVAEDTGKGIPTPTIRKRPSRNFR
jgi:hypothetical protein